MGTTSIGNTSKCIIYGKYFYTYISTGNTSKLLQQLRASWRVVGSGTSMGTTFIGNTSEYILVWEILLNFCNSSGQVVSVVGSGTVKFHVRPSVTF